ncbi:hypothetical protein KKF84_19605 [Myxococcota bacterium]|nr:hypothetical protein [Myxococcota bacterium]MBU1537530.1 hypothetical protein [Myxococcota bacterium]
MDHYAVCVIERIIAKFESRIELIEHRGFPYMAKGALLSHMEGAPKALADLQKIMRWAKTRFYVTQAELQLVSSMIGRMTTAAEPEQTRLGQVRGKVAPWQEWPTMKTER